MFLGVSYTSKGWEPAYPQFLDPYMHTHSMRNDNKILHVGQTRCLGKFLQD